MKHPKMFLLGTLFLMLCVNSYVFAEACIYVEMIAPIYGVVGEEYSFHIYLVNCGDENLVNIHVIALSLDGFESSVPVLSPGDVQDIEVSHVFDASPQPFVAGVVATGFGGESGDEVVDSSQSVTELTMPTNNPPVADPGGPYPGLVGEPVEFDGTGSSDPEEDFLIFDWGFGDGTWGTGPTPSHIYLEEGVYVVVLTVTDPDGLSDTASTIATIVFTNQPPVAYDPAPPDGAENVDTNKTLSWKAGDNATSHDVYFGTDADTVANATTTSPEYKGQKALGEENHDPGILTLSKKYYWRIDEFDSNVNIIYKGNIWSFTTEIGEATNLFPGDGATGVPLDVILSWTPGVAAVTHEIHFDTDPNPPLVEIKPLGDETFDPGLLEPSTTYYWSVTEVNNATIPPVFTGDIWSFTTKDDIIIGEGCMPGFWYNNAVKHDASAWILFTPDTLCSDVFLLNEPLVIKDKGKNTITDPTLLEALGANGGGVNALIRHGIAAILNACSDCVQFEYSSPDQVISMIEDTLNEVPEAYKINELHSMFSYNNEAGCPFDQHGECVGIEEETDE